jgi:hypothetical protein
MVCTFRVIICRSMHRINLSEKKTETTYLFPAVSRPSPVFLAIAHIFGMQMEKAKSCRKTYVSRFIILTADSRWWRKETRWDSGADCAKDFQTTRTLKPFPSFLHVLINNSLLFIFSIQKYIAFLRILKKKSSIHAWHARVCPSARVWRAAQKVQAVRILRTATSGCVFYLFILLSPFLKKKSIMLSKW